MSKGDVSVHASMRLKMQSQEMIYCDWYIIKKAKEADVTGMEEVVEAFMKKHF
jgi:hypothetical protein